MADHDNRAFHTVAGVLTLIAALLGHAVTVPHPQAWFFGAAAAFAVLLPAEVAYFVLNAKRSRPARVVRAPEPADDHKLYSLLGRVLTAIETVQPGEMDLSGTFRRAVARLESRTDRNAPEVVALRVLVRQTTEKLVRHARDENPDSVMLVQRMRVYREDLEEAIAAVEPG
ncbi:hypothetical protein [Amycolatopsis sp. cmx-11-12]|uniref:hypothetical protein n=1 Tax=Amycolatopsis sp. cmx-11-12 TaxID=2785795 RepID=UPI0039172AD0